MQKLVKTLMRRSHCKIQFWHLCDVANAKYSLIWHLWDVAKSSLSGIQGLGECNQNNGAFDLGVQWKLISNIYLPCLTFFLSLGGSFRLLMRSEEALGTTSTLAWRFCTTSLTVIFRPFQSAVPLAMSSPIFFGDYKTQREKNTWKNLHIFFKYHLRHATAISLFYCSISKWVCFEIATSLLDNHSITTHQTQRTNFRSQGWSGWNFTSDCFHIH